MSSGIRVAAKIVILVALILAVVILFGSTIGAIIWHVIGFSTFLVSVFFLPVLFLVLGWFIYSVWAKTYLRAWHITRIRNARHLREAVERGERQE
jgi:hypothetical protein